MTHGIIMDCRNKIAETGVRSIDDYRGTTISPHPICHLAV